MSYATLNSPAAWSTSVSERVRTHRQRRQPFAVSLGLLLLALLGSPLPFGSVQPWFQAALSIVVVAATLCWGFACIREGRLTLDVQPLYWTVVGFVLLGLIQYAASLTVDSVATRDALAAVVTSCLVFFLTGQILSGRSEAAWIGLGAGLTLYLFLLSLFAILQFFSSSGMLYWSVKAATGFGPYVNRDHYAGLMEMIVPLAAGYLLAEGRKGPRRSLAAIALLVGLVSALLSGSRAGMIALVFESLILLIVLISQSRVQGRRRQGGAVCAALMAAVLLFFWADPGGIARRLGQVFQPGRSSDFNVEFAVREQATLDCLRMFRDHPWLGVGMGGFETEYPRYKSFADDLLWDHAQDDYAEAVAETGVAGAILIATSIALFFFTAFRDLRQKLTTGRGWIRFGAALGCCGLLVHSFADFNLHIPANAAWFAFCAGCGSLKT
jgi:O-antigen ligase